jgi:hypothetical protein
MIIASDPAMYRKEYLSKLTKLFVTPARYSQMPIGLLDVTRLRSQPIEAVVVAIGAVDATPANKLLASYCSDCRLNPTDYVAIRDDVAFKTMLSLAGTKLSDESKQSMIQNISNSYMMVRFDLFDTDSLRDYEDMEAGAIRRGPRKIGVALCKTIKLTPGTPMHAALLRHLFLQYKQKMDARNGARVGRRGGGPVRG